MAARASRSLKRRARGGPLTKIRKQSHRRSGGGGQEIDAKSISTITMWEDGKSEHKM